ncbi:MAG: hypothetical protein FWF23_05585, partial [Alphaproteobacteria bacterium]|nr:hypothetical protein [Alphaproteobacteria bacterium]
MLSVIRWIVQIAVLAVVIFWLTEQHGYVNIVWNDMEEFQISLAFCIIAVFLFALIVHLLLRFFSFLIRGPILWQAKRKLDKLNHGQNLLSQALVALFCGDCAKAKSLAASAGKNIDNTMLANWIQATACSANFDNKTAKEIFGKLAQDSEAAPLGYRGLIEIAMQKKNFPEVDRVVSEYYHVRPGAPWLSRMKMLGAIRHHDYERAAKELKIVENSKI